MAQGFMRDDPKSGIHAYDSSRRLLNAFRKANGSQICNALPGCNVLTPEGVQYARGNNLFKERCPKMVAAAMDVLEKILQERK